MEVTTLIDWWLQIKVRSGNMPGERSHFQPQYVPVNHTTRWRHLIFCQLWQNH